MSDLFDDEVEPTISIDDYLKEVEDHDLEADLILGGDEGKECTYSRGYMKRQAVFSCLTCTPDGYAGICTACGFFCHDGHEIVELCTRRNFRCDCGNSKFGTFYCKLLANKDIENSENSYNHNFKGLYCTCNRPYPDPNAEEQEEMIHCCICEDWFHEEHIGLESSDQIPRDEDGEPLCEDFICQGCSVVFSFLSLYSPTIWATVVQHNLVNLIEDTDTVEKRPSPLGSLGKVEIRNSSLDTSMMSNNAEIGSVEKNILLGESSANNGGLNSCTPNVGTSSKCLIGVNLFEVPANLEKRKPLFLSKNWREVLCRCEQCTAYYTLKKIGFLLDREDSIAEYEKMAKQKRNEKLYQEDDVELSLLNKLDHAGKLEFLSGVADLRDELHAFMESFDRSEPVTSADIKQIFDNLAKRRRRML